MGFRTAIVSTLAHSLGVGEMIATVATTPGMWIDDTGPAAQALVITYRVPGPLAELWLQSMQDPSRFGQLPLMNGVARGKVNPGSYSLLARGKTSSPRQAYVIEITSPTQSVWTPKPPRTSDDAADILDLHKVVV